MGTMLNEGRRFCISFWRSESPRLWTCQENPYLTLSFIINRPICQHRRVKIDAQGLFKVEEWSDEVR
jgi:hypothetical protein